MAAMPPTKWKRSLPNRSVFYLVAESQEGSMALSKSATSVRGRNAGRELPPAKRIEFNNDSTTGG